MKGSSTRTDYEDFFADFKDERLNEYCCYCGQARLTRKTTLDHVPSAGLLNDPDFPGLPKVRVCHDCNRDFSAIESYAYCSISSYLACSWKPELQPIPKAAKILASDKRLRRIMFRELNLDGIGRCFWKPDFRKIDAFFQRQAQGHVFLETGELKFEVDTVVDWFDLAHVDKRRRDLYFSRSSDVYPEIGSRAFLRLFSDDDSLPSDYYETDSEGFTVLEDNNYRFRLIFAGGGIEVQSIVRERIAASVCFGLAT